MVAVHSTARGPALGGCRMWTYDDSRAAVRDVLRLSRAMTFKAAVAGLPLGGGKGVIMLRPDESVLTPERREAVLQDFGDTVEALDGAYLTAEDVGTSEPDMEVIAGRTKHVTGLAESHGGSGDPSPWTALGCEVALRVTCERAFGTDDLSGRRVAVIGLGSVGGRLAEMLAEGGAQLVVADVDQSKRALADRLGAEWTDPLSAMTADVDVLAPCALGGVLNDDTVPALRCKAIAGAANNQLAVRRAGRRARRARDPVGARLRLQRGRDHQHLRRAGARGLRARARRRPRARRRRHVAHDLRQRRRLRHARRSPPRSNWAASGSATRKVVELVVLHRLRLRRRLDVDRHAVLEDLRRDRHRVAPASICIESRTGSPSSPIQASIGMKYVPVADSSRSAWRSRRPSPPPPRGR